MKVDLRPLQEKDAYVSVKWRNIPEIWIHTTFSARHEITIEDELRWIRKVLADPTGLRFAILADGEYVGNLYLTDMTNEKAEFHIFIGDLSVWGRGIAKEATSQAIELGRNLGLKRLELRVKEENKAALSIYDKLGFKIAGTEGDFQRMSLNLNSQG